MIMFGIKTGNDPHTHRAGGRNMSAIVHYFGITNSLAFSDGILYSLNIPTFYQVNVVFSSE
jgi:hypothetical protein